ncbi:hypothetical protein [Robiginitomaculum antarcticum]|uniref:hypothetical protein n=1 Tax=Robiginitomaculum antarcticum TaxID=437507 RepID=UPI00036D28CE|nr:hypothetical protein [Robiginitomaculum antarcticum]
MILVVITICLVVAFIFALRTFTGYRGLTAEALREYNYRREDGLVPTNVTETQFVTAYRRAHGPRGAAYIAITMIGVCLITPVLLIAMQWGYEYLWRWSGQPREFEPGYLVWQFMLFGGLLAGWAVTAFMGARIYYRGASGTLDDELARIA